jgi:hypothetical protein
MHPASRATTAPSARPESFWVLPESSSVTDESASPLEDPPLEDPPLEDPLLEEPLLEELPLEEPPLDIATPESSPPPEASSCAAPSLDPTELEAPGELVPQAATRAGMASAKPQMGTGRGFMLVVPEQSLCPVQTRRK